MEDDVLSESQSQSRNDWILWLISAFILATLGAIFLYTRAQNIRREANRNAPEKVQMNQPTPTPSNTGGIMGIIPAGYATEFVGQGDTVKLWLRANSGGALIAGYDAIIEYNLEQIQFLKAENMTKVFQQYVKTDNGRISISGVTGDGSGASKPVRIEDDILAELTFKVAPGLPEGTQINLPMLFTKGATNDSNLVNGESQDVLGSAPGTVLFVAKKLQLVENVPVTFNKSLFVVATDVKPLEPRCADCSATATIAISTEGKAKTVNITPGTESMGLAGGSGEKVQVELGGIMGKTNETYTAKGVAFTVESIEKINGKNTVVIIIAPDKQP